MPPQHSGLGIGGNRHAWSSRFLHQVRVSGEKRRLIYKETGTASASGDSHQRGMNGWMDGQTGRMASV